MKKKVMSLILAAVLCLGLVPSSFASSVDTYDYQPSPTFGTYLGMREDGVFEFDITIPADETTYEYPFALGHFYGVEESSNTEVVSFRAQYLHGRKAGTATVEYKVYSDYGQVPHLKAIAYVTVVPKSEFDPSVNVGFANVQPPTPISTPQPIATPKPEPTPNPVFTTPAPTATQPVPTQAPAPMPTSAPTNTPTPVPTTPGATETGTIYGSDGMARSDRGWPLNQRADGNYEMITFGGIMYIDADGTRHDTRKLRLTSMTPEFKEIDTRELPMELEEYGSCYFGKNYNFLIFGQDNWGESSSVEILRVVKYSKDWERLGAAALYSPYITDVIGQHGNFSFAEAGGMLYIHSGRSTHKLDDGLNHQTNLTFCICISDMTVTDGRYNISNNSTGYVSHSLAQDIIVDKAGHIITLDTGDGHPWGAMLFKYGSQAGGKKFTGKGTPIVVREWPGQRADIRTGGSTCALAETSQGYLSAYLDSGKGASYRSQTDPVSAYLAFTPKDNFSLSATQTRIVLAGTTAANPYFIYLIPTSPESGYVMWYTGPMNVSAHNMKYTLYYAMYSADGSIGQSIKLDSVDVPYAGPIYTGGKVVWAGELNLATGKVNCYSLDSSGKVTTYPTAVTLDGISNPTTTPTGPVTPSTPTNPESFVNFSDVKSGDYFAEPVNWAVENEITNGTSATTFSPNETCSTAHILTFLWRSQGEPEPRGTASFTNLNSGEYYSKAALWAKENGLVTGNTFGANAPCTRAMVVTYLWKLAGSPPAGNGGFSDVPIGSDYAQAVAWAVGQGITNGTSNTTFSPKDTCTRGQIVTFLYRAYA